MDDESENGRTTQNNAAMNGNKERNHFKNVSFVLIWSSLETFSLNCVNNARIRQSLSLFANHCCFNVDGKHCCVDMVTLISHNYCQLTQNNLKQWKLLARVTVAIVYLALWHHQKKNVYIYCGNWRSKVRESLPLKFKKILVLQLVIWS